MNEEVLIWQCCTVCTARNPVMFVDIGFTCTECGWFNDYDGEAHRANYEDFMKKVPAAQEDAGLSENN